MPQLPSLRFDIAADDETAAAFASVRANGEQAIGQLQRGAASTGQVFQRTNAHVSNLGFQLNDIGQGLLLGQSPFQVMLQQGTQVAQVFGQSGTRSIGGALGLLKQSFMSILNPVSLVTFAVIGLGGAAINWLTNLKRDLPSIDEQLKTHESLIREIEAAYKDVVAGVSDYGAESLAILETQIRASALRLADAMQDFDDRSGIAAALQSMLEVVDEESLDAWRNLGVVAERFWNGLDDGTADVVAFRIAVGQLAQTDPENDALQTLADTVLDLTKDLAEGQLRLEEGEAALADFGSQAAGAANRVAALVSAHRELNEQLFDSTAFQALRNNTYADQATFGDMQHLIDFANRPAANDNAGSVREQRDAAAELIGELQHERAVIGLSALDQEVMNNLRRAGADATDEQREMIEKLTREQYHLTAAMDEQEQRLEVMRDLALDVGRSLLQAFSDGKIEAQEFSDILRDITLQLLNRVLSASIGALFSSGGGGGLLGLGLLPKFASGGYLPSGRLGIAGEAGPEIISGPAYITPIRASNANAAGTVVQVINNTGQPVRQRSTRGPDGREMTQIIVGTVGRAIASGDLNAPMAGQFGLRPTTTGR